MTRTRRAVLATSIGVACAVGLVACGVESNNRPAPLIVPVTVKYEGKRVNCAMIDSSRGVALSCAWPDSLRNLDE